MGSALVQCAIELQIRQRLQEGAIRIMNNRVHRQVQVNMRDPQPSPADANLSVRTLKLSPLPYNASCDEVREALLANNIRVTAVRPLGFRCCEISVDASPEVDLMITQGECLSLFWFGIFPRSAFFIFWRGGEAWLLPEMSAML